MRVSAVLFPRFTSNAQHTTCSKPTHFFQFAQNDRIVAAFEFAQASRRHAQLRCKLKLECGVRRSQKLKTDLELSMFVNGLLTASIEVHAERCVVDHLVARNEGASHGISGC